MSEIIEELKNLTSPGYIEKMHVGVDKAINAVAVSGATVGSFSQFEQIVIEVIWLVHKYELKVQKPVEGADEYYLSIGFNVLQQKYGPHGEKASFEMARTGKNGGINAVIRMLAYGYTDTLFENKAKAKIGVLWRKLNPDEMLAVMDEYVRLFGDMWPKEMTEGKALRLKVNFPKTLELHVESIKKLHKSLDV